MKVLKQVDICHREVDAERIAVPISDIKEIEIKVLSKNLKYNDVIYFSTEGNKKVKEYREMYLCSTSTIKFDKNIVEKSIMERILKAENIEGLLLTFEDDSYTFCAMPYVHQKTRIGVTRMKTKNVCQCVKETGNLIEISFMDQYEAWGKITNGRNKEGAKDGKS